MTGRTKIGITTATFLLFSIIGNVYAAPSIIWSQPLPAGLSEQTGTLIPDSAFVMANGVIALGSAPCPRQPWLCSKSLDYPSQQAFWSLDARTGKVKWTIPLPNGSIIEPIAAAEDRFLITAYTDPNLQGSSSFKTLVFDAQTGRIVWSIPRPNWMGDPLMAGNLIVLPDATNPGNWANPDPTLSAYDPSTGHLRWVIHTSPIDDSWQTYGAESAGYGGGTIFAVGGPVGSFSSTTLTAYDASSGSKKWSREGFSAFDGACPTYVNGIVFLKQTPQNATTPITTVNLVALNASGGQTLWNKTIGYSWTGSGTPGSSILFPCPIVGKDRLFILSNLAPYQVLPNLVALNPSDGRELWRHSFPCEQDPLNSTACRPVLWNHQALSDSTLFMSAGFLYGIDTASGKTTWTYGVTADNWNPLAYENGVLYDLNTSNGWSPNMVAFSIGESAVPEMSVNFTAVTILTLTVTLLIIQVLRKKRIRRGKST